MIIVILEEIRYIKDVRCLALLGAFPGIWFVEVIDICLPWPAFCVCQYREEEADVVQKFQDPGESVVVAKIRGDIVLFEYFLCLVRIVC